MKKIVSLILIMCILSMSALPVLAQPADDMVQHVGPQKAKQLQLHCIGKAVANGFMWILLVKQGQHLLFLHRNMYRLQKAAHIRLKYMEQRITQMERFRIITM